MISLVAGQLREINQLSVSLQILQNLEVYYLRTQRKKRKNGVWRLEKAGADQSRIPYCLILYWSALGLMPSSLAAFSR